MRSRLCHQGTVYSASYAALPLLAEIAEHHDPSGYIAALDLASAIVASADGPTDPAAIRRQYMDTVTRLRGMAERNLALADGDVEFIYGLQALMAFENGGVWQRHLNHLADGELPFECPNCREFLILDLEDPEHTLANYTDSSVPPTLVQPARSGRWHGRRTHPRAVRAAARPEVTERLRYALGSATCPNCRTVFDVETLSPDPQQTHSHAAMTVVHDRAATKAQPPRQVLSSHAARHDGKGVPCRCIDVSRCERCPAYGRPRARPVVLMAWRCHSSRDVGDQIACGGVDPGPRSAVSHRSGLR